MHKPRKILVINGHPDADPARFCSAIAAAYAKGADAGGHAVESIAVAALDLPLLRSAAEFNGPPSPAVAALQDKIGTADHLVLIYPLWLGTMPAVLKGFLEQVFRPGFAMDMTGQNTFPEKRLRGKSARIVVTMGMPAAAYRWFYRAHSLKSLERNILKFCGISPVRTSLFGLVEAVGDAKRRRWLAHVEALGRKGH